MKEIKDLKLKALKDLNAMEVADLKKAKNRKKWWIVQESNL